jgi:hypothetical protein
MRKKAKRGHHQGFQAASQIAILGEPPKNPMKLQVVLVETLQVAGLGGSLHGVHEALQDVEVGGRHVLDGQFRRQSFEFPF